MLSVIFHLRFAIPFATLIILIGTFFTIENRLQSNVQNLQIIVDKELPQLDLRLERGDIDALAYKAAIKNMLSGILHSRTKHSAFIFLFFFCGLLLFAFLLCNVRCYQRNLRQVEIAEHYSALFAEVLQSARVGILIRDMKAHGNPAVFVNKSFTAMTGYDQVVLNSKKPDVLFGWHTDKTVVDSFNEAIKHGEAGTFDLQIYRRDGSLFWSEWHISPIVNARGELTHYVSIITDITEMKQAQEALSLAREQAERAGAMKTNFLATMSHEIRTPLNGILGVLKLLSDSPLNEEQSKLLEVALDSGASLHEIINDILDFAKIEAGKINVSVEPFSLRKMLQECLDLTIPVAASKGLEIFSEISSDIPDKVTSDAGRIKQILLNLITNAIKYTEQGLIKIRVFQLLTQTGTAASETLLRFEVIDTGIGISAADQDTLFEEFSRVENSYSRRFSGTGLGLAICKRLVKLMNGEIGVESKPGQGSKFWFMLPLHTESAMMPVKEVPVVTTLKPSLSQSPKPHRILLVEDSSTNRLVAGKFLEKAGYKYDVAVTGAEAVSIAKARTYSLILMDISMPGMDGIETTRRIRELGGWAAEVPIVALTAHVMPGDRESFLAAGMNDHLAKPVDYDALVRTMELWLKAPSKRDDPESIVARNERYENQAGKLLPEIDLSVIQRLAEVLGTEAMLRITGVFLDDFPKRLKDFKPNGGGISLDTIRHTAHTLKSSSANCGLVKFSSLMADLEKAAAEGDMERAEILLHITNSASETARLALEEARGQYQHV